MRIENQVISLEIANKLKKLGVKQESLFYWVTTFTQPYHISYTGGFDSELLPDHNDYASAFTVAELGEMLPEYFETHRVDEMYFVDYIKKGKMLLRMNGAIEDTEANARGKMLIYLLENKLLGEDKGIC
jgi:hypothetical protein